MWYAPTVTTPPASEPVTLAQAKAQCGVTTSEYDDQLTQMIESARAHVEKYCGLHLVTQTVAAKCDCFADFARLSLAPVQSVSAITYVDTAGDTQTLATSIYETRSEGLAPSIVRKYNQQWPAIQTGSRITVTAAVGYESVPADIVRAMLLLIGKQFSLAKSDLFLRSETVEGIGVRQWGGVVEVGGAVDRVIETLLAPYRNWPL